MSVKGGILSGIKSATDIVNEAAKRGMEPFATTIKRSRDKTYRPEQTIVRPSEEVEESLAKKLSRATDKDLTIDDKIIGEIRSAVFSPTFNKVIGIAMINKPYFTNKGNFDIFIDSKKYVGEICDIPFV